MKRYKRINPSREEAIKATNKYKKKLRKQLQLRYEAEERHENGYYNDTLDLLNNDASVMRQVTRSRFDLLFNLLLPRDYLATIMICMHLYVRYTCTCNGSRTSTLRSITKTVSNVEKEEEKEEGKEEEKEEENEEETEEME